MLLYFSLFVSCIALGVSLYSLDRLQNGSDFDGKAFVKDINKQLAVMTSHFDEILIKESNEMRGEYKKGFELSIEHHEELGAHMNENFCRAFENLAELDVEIKLIWKKLEKLGIKRITKRKRKTVVK